MLRRSATPPDSLIYRNRRKALPRPPPWFCSSSPADLCSDLVIRLQGEAAGVNLCSYKIVKQSYFPVSVREKGGSSLDMVQLSKHRVLIINDDGIHATGILLLEKDRPPVHRGCLGRCPRRGEIGRLAFDFLEHPGSRARNRQSAFRDQGHADRLRASRNLRDHENASDHSSVGHQS